MITPRFWCEQDHNFVVLKMKLKHVKIGEMEFVVDGTKMTFHAAPYFLRLIFDQEIIDDATSKATFDVDKEELTVLVPKKTKGEVFTDLDCTTKLLSTELERKRANIEELSPNADQVNEGDDGAGDSDGDSDGGLEYETRQRRAAPEEGATRSSEFYGFNNDFTNFFAPIQQEIEAAEVPVDSTPLPERIRIMQQCEAQAFAQGFEHYLANLADLDGLKRVAAFVPNYYAEGVKPPTWDALSHFGEHAASPPQPRQLVQEVGDGKSSDDASDSSGENADDNEMPQLSEEHATGEEPVQPQQSAGSIPPFFNPGDIGRSQLPAAAAAASADVQMGSVQSGGGLGGFYRTAGEGEVQVKWGVEKEVVGEGKTDPPPLSQLHPERMEKNKLNEWEREQMLRLPKKRYLIANEAETMHGLIDILLAIVYDLITTDGEGNVESIWTITKLSPTLSYVVPLPTMRHVVTCFMRRAVTFPLYRHVNIARRCIWDVAHILSQGSKILVVQLLLQAKWHLDRDEFKYPLNKLYVEPYATWVQSVPPETLQKYSANLASELATVSKGHLGLPLAEMESLLEITEEEGSE
ncbi:Protein SHQ1-like protein [Diplonema papillatum]|nr:Protein SHQ1-like protein [Diplonema papillatum]